MFQLAYGYTLQGDQDPFYVNAVRSTRHIFEACMLPSRSIPLSTHTLNHNSFKPADFFVNIFPVLSNVPDWFPGTGWKRTAREWRTCKEKTLSEPYEWTKAQVVCLPRCILISFQILNTSSVGDREF